MEVRIFELLSPDYFQLLGWEIGNHLTVIYNVLVLVAFEQPIAALGN